MPKDKCPPIRERTTYCIVNCRLVNNKCLDVSLYGAKVIPDYYGGFSIITADGQTFTFKECDIYHFEQCEGFEKPPHLKTWEYIASLLSKCDLYNLPKQVALSGFETILNSSSISERVANPYHNSNGVNIHNKGCFSVNAKFTFTGGGNKTLLLYPDTHNSFSFDELGGVVQEVTYCIVERPTSAGTYDVSSYMPINPLVLGSEQQCVNTHFINTQNII